MGAIICPTASRHRAIPTPQNLFTLGQAAIYPAGSWEISLFNSQADFRMGAFPPPLPAGKNTLYISDHTDIALGMNSATTNPDAARQFLQWMTISGVRRALQQRPARVFLALESFYIASGSIGAGVPSLADDRRVDDSQFLPDIVAWYAQSGERSVGRLGRRNQWYAVG